MNRFVSALAVALCLCMPFASAHGIELGLDYSTGIMMHDDKGIQIEGDDVVIDNDEGNEARITPDGQFLVNGKNVPVTSAQKAMLIQYSKSVLDVKDQAVKIGKDAASFAVSVVGDALRALLSGEDEHEIDRRAKARADEFKQRALPICKEIRSLKQLQDQLADTLPVFKPFAVIEAHEADDCEHDIESDD